MAVALSTSLTGLGPGPGPGPVPDTAPPPPLPLPLLLCASPSTCRCCTIQFGFSDSWKTTRHAVSVTKGDSHIPCNLFKVGKFIKYIQLVNYLRESSEFWCKERWLETDYPLQSSTLVWLVYTNNIPHASLAEEHNNSINCGSLEIVVVVVVVAVPRYRPLISFLMIRALTKPFSSAATIREAFGTRTDLMTVSLIVASSLRLVYVSVSISFRRINLLWGGGVGNGDGNVPGGGGKGRCVGVRDRGREEGREGVVPAQICHQNVNERWRKKKWCCFDTPQNKIIHQSCTLDRTWTDRTGPYSLD